MMPINQSPVANMLRERRKTPGTGGAGAEALINQMGQPPNMALPSSTAETRPVELPNNPSQVVTGKDGKEYHVVIDPKVGLQTFIPVKGQANAGRVNRIANVGAVPGRMGRVGAMANTNALQGDEGAPQGSQLMNRIRGMISGLG